MVIMRAYGQTSDANSGLLRESWSCGRLTAEMAINCRDEYGWKTTERRMVEFVPTRQKRSALENFEPLLGAR